MPWSSNGDGGNPWQRNSRQGPPEIDELLSRMWSRLFGRAPGGSDGGGKGGKKWPLGSGVIVAALVVLWLLSGFYIVEASERGVVLRFGKYDRTTMPGPGWHIPYPVESVSVVNVTGNRSVEKRTTMLTQDENIVELKFSVQYRLKNAEDYLFNVENPDIAFDRSCRFKSTICGVLDSAIRTTVGRNKMDFILREGRAEIASRTMVLMQEILDTYGTGIEILTINLEDSQPPDAVQDAFQDATKAREDMERYKNEAQAYANEVIPQARGEAAPHARRRQGLPGARGRECRGRGVALHAIAGRIPEGAGSDAPAHVSAGRGVGAVQELQGRGGCRQGQQHAVPAAGPDHGAARRLGRRAGIVPGRDDAGDPRVRHDALAGGTLRWS